MNQHRLFERQFVTWSLLAFGATAAAMTYLNARPLATVLGLLALLYFALIATVYHFRSVIDHEVCRGGARWRAAHRETMTSMGQLAAGVAHQLTTPLAFSRNNVVMVRQALDQLEGAVHRQLRHAAYHSLRGCSARDAVHDVPGQDSLTRDLAAALLEMREASEMLGDVLIGLEQMGELVNNLRTFTRLDHAPSVAVDLNTSLASVCSLAQTVISTKVQLERDFQPLPPIRCNVFLLNQVFLNLIHNATQAIRRSGTIVVSTRADDQCLTISVCDNGEGIAPHMLPHIFEPCFTTRPHGEGAGLGLSIARNIVQEHGGDIQVSSEVGLGTEVRVRLPIERAL